MIPVEQLIERIGFYKSHVNSDLLVKAYNYAKEKHKHQVRASGEAYFSHPIAVALILTQLRLDEATIAVALLHDTIEDTTATKAELEELFGQEIADLVEGLTHLKKLDLISKKAIQAENLRKLLLAIAKDIRVLLVKLADRLHNMRTLAALSPQRQHNIAQETLDIYAPLAGRMGMQDIREELEDLSFCYLNDKAYHVIKTRLDKISSENKNLLEIIGNELQSLFTQHKVTAIIKRRMKKPYAIFHKMETKGLKFEELSDIFGFRVIVPDIIACYQVLGLIHTRWTMVPGRFKDYISTPKQNDYQSIHTTVISHLGQRIELQIRTDDMDEIAEYGIAAYASYKGQDVFAELGKIGNTKAYAWLRKTIELLNEGEGPEEFLEHTKLELFQDQVFCFTPRGKLVILPLGATVLDFAYAVHTDIGNSCAGAKINGRVVSLVTELQNGDEVEILCEPDAKTYLVYEQFVRTAKARSAIRKATKNAAYEKYCTIGYIKLTRYFKKYKHSFVKESLHKLLEQFSYKDINSLLAAVGRDELKSRDIFTALYPTALAGLVSVPAKKRPRLKFAWRSLPKLANLSFIRLRKIKKRRAQRKPSQLYLHGKDYPIYGINNDIKVSYAAKGIVPGDKIIGLLDKATKEMVIYPIKAKLPHQSYQDGQVIDIVWSDELPCERYRAHICVYVANTPGALNKIMAIIAANDVNVKDVKIVDAQADIGKIEFIVEVWNGKQLKRVLSQIKDEPLVSKALRLYD
ncbi:MAG: bifunctional (p)ppGpp synthetase/guanosine-3',5'-bis(diphosphate) 3'-pyrophosphohydrolase [Alphaproteobacteria bacterium]|nr:bifunctional (p)ppGpp synthetase/guanosine-3',5'-bis(diphosphate) 3'-pyrophosphohydrolase [Alphaproteobacteria bacterium]